jgi:hypothetical protein
MVGTTVLRTNGTRRHPWALLICGSLMTASLGARQAPAAPSPQATAASAPRVFGSPTGVVLNFVKPDKTADFEAVVAKLKEALEKSANPQRKQQAAGWKVYKAAEPAAGGAALYMYIVDPVVKGADYSVSAILGEAFPPDQLTALYKQYSESYASGQNFVNLALIADLAK